MFHSFQKNIKQYVFFSLGIIIIFFLFFSIRKKTPSSQSIGIFFSFSHPNFQESSEAFKSMISNKFNNKITFVEKNAEDSLIKARKIARAFHYDPKIKIIYTIGPLATHIMSQIEMNKKLIFSSVQDINTINLNNKHDNMFGVEDRLDADQITFTIKALNSKMKDLTLFYNNQNSYEKSLIDDIKKKCELSGIKTREVTFQHQDIKNALKKVSENPTEVLFLPLDFTISTNMDLILKEIGTKIALITKDSSLINHGICAACDVDYKKSGEKAANIFFLLNPIKSLLPIIKQENQSMNKLIKDPIPQYITFNEDIIKEKGLQLNKGDKKQIKCISNKNKKDSVPFNPF